MKIAAYCRVSTEKEDQLNSLDKQKQFFAEYADKNRHSLVMLYADEGISGTKIKNRTQFQKLMRDARLGLFDMVVVKDISRFARNTVDLLSSTRKLKAYGIETTFLTANMTVLGQSEFVLTIFGALAQEESANTSKRVKFGKQMNAQRGRVPNLVYGYDKTKGDYFNLAVNDFEAKIVQRVYDLYVSGGYGANKIAQILNSEGIKTKRDCKWSQNGISRILTNELYCGKIINGKEEVEDFLTGKRRKKEVCDRLIADKPALRIIDDDTFVKASKLLESRNNSFSNRHRRQSNKHLFSTLIQCACCGYSFRRTRRCYANTYTKWVCSGRNTNGKDSCNNLTKLDEQELKDALQAYFVGILQTKDDVIKHIAAEFNRMDHTKEENADYGQELTARLNKANKSRKKYMDMYEDELITREELREKASALNSEIEKCENERKLTEYNLNKGSLPNKILDSTFRDLESILSMDNLTNARLKQVIDKIVVDEQGRIDVYLKPLSDRALDQSVPIGDNRT